MKDKTALIIVALLVISSLVIVGIRQRGASEREQQFKEWLRDTTRYDGAEGETITAFDERTNQWLEELREETIEETLPKLTDAAEYITGWISGTGGFVYLRFFDEGNEKTYYSKTVKSILSNRRFRKAYEDLQTINKKQAAELLTKNIRDNLAALRIELQKDIDTVARGEHTGSRAMVLWEDSGDVYRPMSHPERPPSRLGRKLAIHTYLLLGSLLELREMRPAVEEVIAFAREEYGFFNSVEYSVPVIVDDDDWNSDADSEGDDVWKDDSPFDFLSIFLDQSLYNPSLLVTATFCDPTWKVAEKSRLPADKLVEGEIVDYQARALEQDKYAIEGWVPAVPHDGMLKIRYYKEITDAEFNDFFGNSD